MLVLLVVISLKILYDPFWPCSFLSINLQVEDQSEMDFLCHCDDMELASLEILVSGVLTFPVLPISVVKQGNEICQP
jgi:hypothetical protein